jgi:hypothetical protein
MDVPHQSILAAYNRTERQLEDFLGAIPLETAHLSVWSPVLASIILEAASQLDSLWKLQLRALGKDPSKANIKDHFANFGNSVAKRWLVVWSDGGHKFIPFEAWDAVTLFDKDQYPPVPWWQAYNDLKHDRWENKREATIRNAVFAVGGLFVAIVHSPLMGDGLRESGWLRTDWNPDIVVANLRGDPISHATQASFETSLMSYAVAHGGNASVGCYYRSTPRFYNWFTANYGKPVPTL